MTISPLGSSDRVRRGKAISTDFTLQLIQQWSQQRREKETATAIVCNFERLLLTLQLFSVKSLFLSFTESCAL